MDVICDMKHKCKHIKHELKWLVNQKNNYLKKLITWTFFFVCISLVIEVDF
jgi:hypothetical protein